MSTQTVLAPLTEVFSGVSPEYHEKFNKTSFQFHHNLVGHPLFELPALADLANYLLEKRGASSMLWNSSNVPVGKKWSECSFHEQREGVADAIQRINESGSWVLLYSVQNHPAYAQLLDQAFGEIAAFTGERQEEITWKDAYIFIASPGSVTPYHIDHEATFLFQVHGRRVANIWERDDYTVLTEAEREQYYVGNLSAANYRAEHQERAKVYDLNMGTGVHHPMLAPHWFKNGSDYSIALGVHFCIKRFDREARVFQVNHFLRKAGLTPTRPGVSAWRDELKMRALGAISTKRPKNKFELLRSGIMRAQIPWQMIKRLKNR